MCHFNQNRSYGERRDILTDKLYAIFRDNPYEEAIKILNDELNPFMGKLEYTPVNLEDIILIAAHRAIVCYKFDVDGFKEMEETIRKDAMNLKLKMQKEFYVKD